MLHVYIEANHAGNKGYIYVYVMHIHLVLLAHVDTTYDAAVHCPLNESQQKTNREVDIHQPVKSRRM